MGWSGTGFWPIFNAFKMILMLDINFWKMKEWVRLYILLIINYYYNLLYLGVNFWVESSVSVSEAGLCQVPFLKICDGSGELLDVLDSCLFSIFFKLCHIKMAEFYSKVRENVSRLEIVAGTGLFPVFINKNILGKKQFLARVSPCSGVLYWE